MLGPESRPGFTPVNGLTVTLPFAISLSHLRLQFRCLRRYGEAALDFSFPIAFRRLSRRPRLVFVNHLRRRRTHFIPGKHTRTRHNNTPPSFTRTDFTTTATTTSRLPTPPRSRATHLFLFQRDCNCSTICTRLRFLSVLHHTPPLLIAFRAFR
ncbi:hypothetical protein B0T17DRAFT_145777 [Bombardia bombarda]|uniref:Uncharacterized protein n=1 Tax=Bombardia bombarda TaxID=252184 RepID=A0AA39X6K8_9PEZI|nr:hypothetical protein B0T17DRAFT_145777 [Bombardia bombarda]